MTSLETQTGAASQFLLRACVHCRWKKNKTNEGTIISNTQHRDRYTSYSISLGNIADALVTPGRGRCQRVAGRSVETRLPVFFLGTGQGMLKSGDRTQAGASLDCPWLVRLAMEREG